MKLFSKEVKDMNELNEVLKNNKEQDWIYLVYKGNLKNGELKIAEPNKCLGYERYKIGEVDKNELSNGARELYNIVSEKYSYLK